MMYTIQCTATLFQISDNIYILPDNKKHASSDVNADISM